MELLRLVLEAAVKAPSGGNFQPARFLLLSVPGGPAARAGMKPGDVLKAINGKQIITDVNQAISETTALRPGEAIQIDVIRQGQIVRLAINVGRRPPTRAPNQ